MELPPGWRGYGAKDYVDHPDTPRAPREVEAMQAKLARPDRFALQAALMPYEHLLPERFRGRNERIDEPLRAACRRPQAGRMPMTNPRRHDARAAPQAQDQRPALQPAGARQRRRACRPTSSRRPTG